MAQLNISDIFDRQTPGRLHVLGTITVEKGSMPSEAFLVGRCNGNHHVLWTLEPLEFARYYGANPVVDCALGVYADQKGGGLSNTDSNLWSFLPFERAHFATLEKGTALLLGDQTLATKENPKTDYWTVPENKVISVRPHTGYRQGGRIMQSNPYYS